MKLALLRMRRRTDPGRGRSRASRNVYATDPGYVAPDHGYIATDPAYVATDTNVIATTPGSVVCRTGAAVRTIHSALHRDPADHRGRAAGRRRPVSG